MSGRGLSEEMARYIGNLPAQTINAMKIITVDAEISLTDDCTVLILFQQYNSTLDCVQSCFVAVVVANGRNPAPVFPFHRVVFIVLLFGSGHYQFRGRDATS